MASNNPVVQKIEETLELNHMPYAMSVIVSRALPEIDGFKPSHRKLLYTMYTMGLMKGARTKSANVVGQTMKLNPHGEGAIYETLVRLTRGHDALLHPFIDSKGNFGKHYSRDMLYAASRYTEVKLDPICEEVFRDIEKNTVDFTDNYDGTLKEPVLLPTAFPNILVNANQGIAVGMANSMCSFNLAEVCAATAEYIKDSGADLMKYLKAPDFSTGGELIYNYDAIKSIYETGRGSFKLRARYKFDKKNSCIEIYEIPYTTTCEAIMDAIIDLVKKNKVREINDVRDETDLKGLRIAIDIKKSADPDEVMKKLFRFTPLQDTFNCNFNILIEGRPRVMGIHGILDEWLKFRTGCIKRQLMYDVEKMSEKLHLLLGLKKILLDIDRAISIIRKTQLERDVIPNLMEGFGIDEKQAEFIAEIKLRYLNREYILNRVREVENLRDEIEKLKDLHGNDRKIRKLITAQLEKIAGKYGCERRTILIEEENVDEITSEQLVEDYNLKLFLTEHNYLKKIPLVSLRGSAEQKVKDDDRIIQEVETHNKAELLLFSNKCSVYKIRVFEVEDCKASELGEYLQNLLGLEEEERIIYITATDDYSGTMLFVYEDGKAARIEMKSYETKTNRKKLANAYCDKSRLVYISFLQNETELAARSSIDKVLVFDTSAIPVKSTRSSQGVQVMKSKNGSRLTEVKPLEETGIKEPDYYRTKNLPAVGKYLRDSDCEIRQASLPV